MNISATSTPENKHPELYNSEEYFNYQR